MFELDQIDSEIGKPEENIACRASNDPPPNSSGRSAGPDFLEALARGLRVIEAFSPRSAPLTLSDVAKLVDLPRASVRRTLAHAGALGYAETDERLFRLTPRILTLARAYLSSNPSRTSCSRRVER